MALGDGVDGAQQTPGGDSIMVIQYDADELKMTFLFRWKGTIFPMVFSQPVFWVLLAVHGLLLKVDGDLLKSRGRGLPELDWSASTVAMSMLTFFVVFYANHCFLRYYQVCVRTPRPSTREGAQQVGLMREGDADAYCRLRARASPSLVSRAL